MIRVRKNEARSVSTLSDDRIQELIDGRLSPEEAAAVVALLAKNPDLRRRVADLCLLNEMVRGLGQYILDEPVPERLTEAARRYPSVCGKSSER